MVPASENFLNILPVFRAVLRSLDSVTDQEKEVLNLRFGLNAPVHSVEEVASVLRLSPDEVQSIEERALNHVGILWERYAPISHLDLSSRVKRVLSEIGIESLNDLTKVSEHELTDRFSFGAVSIRDLKRKLAILGLQLLTPPESTQTPIQQSSLPSRAKYTFKKMGIKVLGDLSGVTEQELKLRRNMGRVTVRQIKKVLVPLGIDFKQPELEGLDNRTTRSLLNIFVPIQDCGDLHNKVLSWHRSYDLNRIQARANKMSELLGIKYGFTFRSEFLNYVWGLKAEHIKFVLSLSFRGLEILTDGYKNEAVLKILDKLIGPGKP